MNETLSQPISKEQIAALPIPFREVLPSRFVKIISDRTGYSDNWVIKVLNGTENPNQDIIHAAFELIKEQDDKRDQFLRQFVWEG